MLIKVVRVGLFLACSISQMYLTSYPSRSARACCVQPAFIRRSVNSAPNAEGRFAVDRFRSAPIFLATFQSSRRYPDLFRNYSSIMEKTGAFNAGETTHVSADDFLSRRPTHLAPSSPPEKKKRKSGDEDSTVIAEMQWKIGGKRCASEIVVRGASCRPGSRSKSINRQRFSPQRVISIFRTWSP